MAGSLRIQVRIDGARGVASALRRLGPQARKAVGRALYEEGEALLAVSKPLVPVRYGALRASGHVQPPRERLRGVVVIVGYGGAAVPYAVYVHERVELRHRPPTQAKYLSTPYELRAPGLPARVGRAVRLELGL